MKTSSAQTPTAPCSQSLFSLEERLLQQCADIEKWFALQWQKTPSPIYGSVDLRNAGFKIAPVDMNLFPAGFNNLNPSFLAISIAAAKKVLHGFVADAQKILVIPESHTRNLRYWDNINILQTIIAQAGFEVRLGSLDQSLTEPITIKLSSVELDPAHSRGTLRDLNIAPLKRVDDVLWVDDFKADIVILNNDLSEGIPDILRNLKQPLLPPAELGWSVRLKSKHFQYYAEVAHEFAQHFSFDHWLVNPLFRHCGKVDFMQQEGLDCVISNAEILFKSIAQKYADYHIKQTPFLVVKADAGTYGMAVMTVRNIDELKSMNRKQRTKMSTTKGGQPVQRVIIQEGVHSFETVQMGDEIAVAEPVIYLWGERVVGGFYRVHKARGVDENLNSPGMQFEPLAFRQTCHEPLTDKDPVVSQNQYYIYGLVAKLSMLAAAREMKEYQKNL